MLLPTSGLIFLAGSGEPEAHPPTGRISGTVTLSEDLVAKRPRFRIYSGFGPGSVVDPKDNETGDSTVVVYLEGLPPRRQANSTHAQVEQRNERFAPHVTAVVRGSEVAFPNRDPFYHNVFSLSSAKSFDLGRYAAGEGATVHFDTPGIVQVYCQIHSDMSAYILVLENEFFAVTGDQGGFLIEGIPPGDYELVAWHERASPVRHLVRVARDSTSEVEIVMPMDQSTDAY